MYDTLPDEILTCILDYFDISELLCAMLIDRRSRNLAMAHRTYWRTITLDSSHPRLRDISLFKARIASSATRPINVSIVLRDPTVILDAVRNHMFHIEALEMHSCHGHADSIVTALTPPAPILTALRLCLRLISPTVAECEPEPVFLPETLFQGYAPALRLLRVYDIGIASPIPPALHNLETLDTGFVWGRLPYLVTVPSPFAHCRNLRNLTLMGGIILDGDFWDPEAWKGIDRLLFNGSPGMSTTWQELGLPVSQIRSVGVQVPNAASAAALFLHLLSGSGRDPLVRLAFEYITDDGHFRARLDDVHTARIRTVWAKMSSSVNPEPEEDVLLELSRISSSISHFSIPLSGWERVIERFPSTGMSRLVSVEIWLDDSSSMFNSSRWHDSSRASIFCPDLRSVKLSGPGNLTPHITLDLVSLAGFIAATFPGAPLPISIRLVHVVSRGSWDAYNSTIIPCS